MWSMVMSRAPRCGASRKAGPRGGFANDPPSAAGTGRSTRRAGSTTTASSRRVTRDLTGAKRLPFLSGDKALSARCSRLGEPQDGSLRIGGETRFTEVMATVPAMAEMVNVTQRSKFELGSKLGDRAPDAVGNNEVSPTQ